MGRSLLIFVDSICFTGVILAAVPVRNTSSAISNSVLSTGLSITFIPVSYTHLRAHETQ